MGKVIDGKQFNFNSAWKRKPNAEKRAKALRERGAKVRIVVEGKGKERHNIVYERGTRPSNKPFGK